MTALTEDRNTEMKDGELIAVPVAAAAVIYAGALVVADANGYAAPGSTATGLTSLGRAEEAVDNTAGADGDRVVHVRRNRVFRFENDGSITQAQMGQTAWIVDDQTVAATGGLGERSAAGKILGVDADGVWVEMV